MNVVGITIKDSAKVDKIYRSSRRVYLLYNKNKLQIRKKKKIKKIIVNRNVTIFQTTKNQPKYQQFKMVDEICEEDSSLFFFSHDQEEHVRRATCWTIPLSKGIKNDSRETCNPLSIGFSRFTRQKNCRIEESARRPTGCTQEMQK